jgi:hypothetical protein
LKKGRGLLVDFNLPVVMLPMIISGVTFGYIFNSMTPDVVICAVFASGLMVMVVATCKKAY